MNVHAITMQPAADLYGSCVDILQFLFVAGPGTFISSFQNPASIFQIFAEEEINIAEEKQAG